MMKTKIPYQRPETWTVYLTAFMQTYGDNTVTLDFASGETKGAELGESNESFWDDDEPDMTTNNLWDK